MNRRSGSDFDKHQWPLLALWLSIGLHGALIALVRIVPPQEGLSGNTIEARLMPRTETRTVPLYLPNMKPPAMDKILAYAPPPVPQKIIQQQPSPPQQQSFIPQIEIPLAVDLHYYSARELDIMPNGNIPEPALPSILSGKIKYQLKIEENGSVSDVDVLSVELAGDADSAALAKTQALLRATRFTPAIKNGRPVRAVVVYELMINPVESQRQ